MKANNTLTKKSGGKMTFSAAVTGESVQKMMLRSLGDQRSAARLTSTLIEAVASTPKLAECSYDSIVAAGLKGEGEGLIYGLGYYIIPYGSVAKFQRSYKGLAQLAISSGYYADIDCIEIREGEWKGRNRRTGKADIDLSVYATDEERESRPIIGYYAYFELKDGTFRYEYWSRQRVLEYADKYSPAFDLEKYKAMQEGKLSKQEAARLMDGSPWYDDGEEHQKMCKKTVFLQLMNSGYAPLSNEVRMAMRSEAEEDYYGSGGEQVVASVSPETGEATFTEAAEGPQERQTDAAPPAPAPETVAAEDEAELNGDQVLFGGM